MKAELEKYLWDNIGYAGEIAPTPRSTITEMLADGKIKSPKQAWATLDKWTSKGIYEYGVCLDMGWKVGRREDAR